MDQETIRQAVLFPHVQVMAREKFAELVGVSVGIVDGWCDRGYVPSVVIGKHRLINMVKLSQWCLEQESYR
jgi:hypothetical protein